MHARIAMLMASSMLVACGGGPAQRTFPTSEELSRIANLPPPEMPARTPAPVIDSWTLDGPFPDVPAGPAAGGEPWSDLLVADQGARPTAAMACAARELARFVARHDAAAPDALRAFIAARCGSTAAGLQMSWVSGEVGPDEDALSVLQRWAPGPRESAAAMARSVGGGGAFGGAFAAHEGNAVWMVVGQRAGQALDGFTGLPDDAGRVVVRGQRDPRYARLSALVTQGRFRFAVCEPLKAPPGHYGFACPIDPADEMATIEAVGVPPEQVLGDTFLGVTVWPRGTPVDTWRSSSKTDPRPVGGADAVPNALVTAVNALRSESGAEPVVLDEAQSGALAALAPHYWSAVWRNDRDLADKVALGVMAGWKVSGSIRHGNFAAAATDDRTDVGVLLRDMLDSPFQRRMLFDPATRRVAVGALLMGSGRLAALVGGYHVVDRAQFDPVQAASRVRGHLDTLRAVDEGAPLQPWAAVEKKMRVLGRKVTAGTLSGRVALDRALKLAAEATRGPVAGRIIQVSRVEHVRLPPELVGVPRPVAFAVGIEQVKGEPWVRHTVLMVWPSRPSAPDGTLQARLATP